MDYGNCLLATIALYVQWPHESLMALHILRDNYTLIVSFFGGVTFVTTHPTHYYLEFDGSTMDMETHPNQTQTNPK